LLVAVAAAEQIPQSVAAAAAADFVAAYKTLAVAAR
jgi:hypothetical protein